jgi:cytochrome P450
MPFFGNLPDMAGDVLGFFTRCSREYGDVVGLRLVSWPAVLLNHPDYSEYIFVKNHQNFIKHRFFWRHVRAIFGQGLLTSEGEAWHRQRRLAAPAFAGQQVSRYGDAMVRYAERMVERWQPGQAIDAHREAMALTFEIAAKTLFDADAQDDVEELGHVFDQMVEEIAVRFRRPFRIPDIIPVPGNLRYRRGVQRIDRLVAEIIRAWREDPGDRGDLLSRLMLARDESGRPMSERQIRDEVITLLLAGHETTALTLAWTWYLLARHPDADARLAAEVRNALGNRPPTVEDLLRLRFTEQVVTESLRLYPPAYAIGREALQDCEIGGFAVPAGTTVYVSPWVTHHDPRWFPDPWEFRPERWNGDFARQLPRFAYMPFGGGPRICIGSRFAMMEAVLILATVAQRLRLEWQREHPVQVMPSITLRPKGGVWVRPTPR